MADEDLTDLENAEDADTGGQSGSKLKWIIIGVVALLLVAGLSVLGTWFMLKDRLAEPDMGGIDEIPMDEPVMSVQQGEAIYHALQPAFIVNYTTGGRSRFLQVELSVLTRDASAIEVMVLHNPLIRNNLLDVFAEQDVLELGTVQGKEKLAEDLTKAIQDVLIIEMGRPGIESVLFRSFVMQ